MEYRLGYREEIILSSLGSRPKTSKELQTITNYKDTEIRQAVRELRLHGVPVCSNGKGFWIWNGKDDSWRHTKNQIKSRAKSLIELYNAMERNPVPGQLGLYD